MPSLNIFTWLWGDKYPLCYLERLRDGLRRHLREDHRLVCLFHGDTQLSQGTRPSGVEFWPIAQDDLPLLEIKGCFARLRLFDPAFHSEFGLKRGNRAVCIDLDTVVTGPLDILFYRPESFLILTGANAQNPCPYNGSLWMLRVGYALDVWQDFSLEAAAKVPFFGFPDDQGWLWHKLPGHVGWKAGSASGVYAFQKPGWPKGDELPADARLVVFPGWRDPGKFEHLPWVKKHWHGI